MEESFSASEIYMKLSTKHIPIVTKVCKLEASLVDAVCEIHQCSPENVHCTYNFIFFFPKIFFLSSLYKVLGLKLFLSASTNSKSGI